MVIDRLWLDMGFTFMVQQRVSWVDRLLPSSSLAASHVTTHTTSRASLEYLSMKNIIANH